MSLNQFRGGWKVNTSNYNAYKEEQRRYRQTPEWRAKNNFGIYVAVLTLVLLAVFA